MKYKKPISVVMPCYNSETFITQAIQSILEQSYELYELIIINDGSTDSTELEIRRFSDSRIKYIKNTKNRGSYVARNIGMSLAIGKYICMMDSDDTALPNRLELQYKYLESHRNIGCIGSAIEVVDETCVTKGVIKRPLDYSEIKTWLMKNCSVFQPTIMFRSKLINKHKLLYNETFRYAGDYEFIIRASNKFPIRNLDKALVKYRIHPNQISSVKRKEQMEIADIARKILLRQFEVIPTEKEIELHLKLMKDEYIDDNDLKICEIWCNKLLKANDVKKLYNSSHLYKMLDFSLQTAVYNNSLGGWSIEKDMIKYIGTIISVGDSILEFGSGKGTEALLGKYKVVSIEHDKKFFFKRTGNHHIILAPIQNNWYDRKSVASALDQKYDLILVDGPPGELRKGIMENLDLFKGISIPIIFDDVDRIMDKNIMISFCNELDLTYKVIGGVNKEFAICNCRR